MDLELKGKVAVVTGGSVGIGLAIAEGLAAEGVNLVLAARGAERVQDEARRIAGRYGVRAEGVACDVATREGTDALIDAAKAAFGGADILINNAGLRLERDRDGGGRRQVAGLLGVARHGGGAARPGHRAAHEGARRRGDPAQRLDLRGPAAMVRADLQHDQSGADDVLEVPGDRTRRRQYPGELRQSRTGPHPRLDQDR